MTYKRFNLFHGLVSQHQVLYKNWFLGMARLKLCFGMFAITCSTMYHPHWPGTKSEGKTNKHTIDLHSGKTGNFIWKGLSSEIVKDNQLLLVGNIFCSLPIFFYFFFLLDRLSFHQSWLKEWCLLHGLEALCTSVL